MKIKIIAFIFGFVLLIPISAQSQISLLDIDKVKEFLTLRPQQFEAIIPIIDQIKNILEEDRKIIAGLKERVNDGDEPGFVEKLKVKRGRDGRADDIEELIEDIEDKLDEEQKIKFEQVDKPILKSLDKKEIFG